MTTRARVAFAVAVVVLTGGVVTLVATGRREARTPAERDAREACTHAAQFEEIVASNGPAARATAELETAAAHAARAAAADPRWLPLSGGVQTLQRALERDDAHAARVGIGVVLEHCRTGE